MDLKLATLDDVLDQVAGVVAWRADQPPISVAGPNPSAVMLQRSLAPAASALPPAARRQIH